MWNGVLTRQIEPTEKRNQFALAELRINFERMAFRWRGQMPWEMIVNAAGSSLGLGLHQAHTATASANSVCRTVMSGAT